MREGFPWSCREGLLDGGTLSSIVIWTCFELEVELGFLELFLKNSEKFHGIFRGFFRVESLEFSGKSEIL
jgi:hypothetical protein